MAEYQPQISQRNPAPAARGDERRDQDRDPRRKATAAALIDVRRLAAIGRSVDRLVQPGTDDPLIALFGRTSAEARHTGLPEQEVEAELAAYDAERRS